MRVSRIYTASELQADTSVILDEKASHHLSKVLRQKIGDALILFNGDGQQYPATITAIDKKHVTASTSTASAPVTESPLHIHLGIGVSKGDRFDWVLQKSTELGVNHITPLLTERTEFKLKADRLEKKLLHWQQILISACEQCGRNIIPTIHPPALINSWCDSIQADKKFVLHHRSHQGLSPADKAESTALLIGPEGGLSDSEIHYAEQQQFQALTLGPRVLRTETAPIVAISILQSVWGDLR